MMSLEQLLKQLAERIDLLETPAQRAEAINATVTALQPVSPFRQGPVARVLWVPIEQVEANDYNPNSVARIEMGLLLRSIQADGYTQPVVTVWDEERHKYVIVDGFHRYFTMKSNDELREAYHGHLPIVVIDKSISDRMAATIRHNRARGRHSVAGMANMVFQMLDQGMSDHDICTDLGMEAEELVRLKHITGFSKLFKQTEYKRAWVTRNQIQLKLAREGRGFGNVPPAGQPEEEDVTA